MPFSTHNTSDQVPPGENADQGKHYQRIRERLRSSRMKQFGLGGIFLLTGLVAGTLGFVRESPLFVERVIVPLTVFLGVCVSFAGIIILLEAPRQLLKGHRRQSRMFLRWGVACLLLGIPLGIGLAFILVQLGRMAV